MEQKNRHFLWLALLCIGLGTATWATRKPILTFIGKTFQNHEQQIEKSDEWITVFVHGTFGCYFGLLSLPSVITDTVGKTLYKKLVESKRKDPANFLDQAILQRGLIKVQPSYDLHVTNGQRFSAYPLAQAFQDISKYSSPGQSSDTFYTFGWSGLLSQKQRRVEAVRFYNSLNSELERYHCIGKHPKIRLVAHSHGGNLCLNFGAITEILSLSTYDNIDNTTPDAGTNESLTTMLNYIKKLPNKESVAYAKKLKHLDHVPTTSITIDELVLFGTPVQVETEPFYFSPTFKKIYHFYSEGDAVQAIDSISTKKNSNQIINRTTENLPLARAFPDLVQCKIIMNHHRKTKFRKNKSVDFYKQYDLGHKDLWAISWHQSNNPIAPLPVFVLTPLIIAALNKQPAPNDNVDINIKITTKHLKIQVSPHDEEKLYTRTSISRDNLEKMRKNLRRWDPYHTVNL